MFFLTSTVFLPYYRDKTTQSEEILNRAQKISGVIDLVLIITISVCAGLILMNNAQLLNLPGLNVFSNNQAFLAFGMAGGTVFAGLVTLSIYLVLRTQELRHEILAKNNSHEKINDNHQIIETSLKEDENSETSNQEKSLSEQTLQDQQMIKDLQEDLKSAQIEKSNINAKLGDYNLLEKKIEDQEHLIGALTEKLKASVDPREFENLKKEIYTQKNTFFEKIQSLEQIILKKDIEIDRLKHLIEKNNFDENPEPTTKESPKTDLSPLPPPPPASSSPPPPPPPPPNNVKPREKLVLSNKDRVGKTETKDERAIPLSADDILKVKEQMSKRPPVFTNQTRKDFEEYLAIEKNSTQFVQMILPEIQNYLKDKLAHGRKAMDDSFTKIDLLLSELPDSVVEYFHSLRKFIYDMDDQHPEGKINDRAMIQKRAGACQKLITLEIIDNLLKRNDKNNPDSSLHEVLKRAVVAYMGSRNSSIRQDENDKRDNNDWN